MKIKGVHLSGFSRLILLVGALLILILWAFTLKQVEDEYVIQLNDTSRETVNLTRVFAEHMQNLLNNLLHNSWKYTSKHPTARIEFGVVEKGGLPVYYVRDDGAGFDMAYSAKLFKIFERLHNEAEFPGYGIGLASAERIVHKHGGEIWAEGAVDQGATFYFTVGES